MPEQPRYYHGSLSKLKPGDVIHPVDELQRRGMLGKQFSNLSGQYSHLHGETGGGTVNLEDGRSAPRTSLTYHTTDPTDAWDWGARPLLKSSPEDFQRMAAAGYKHLHVYEVEPESPARPREGERHSPHEVVAPRAVVKGVHSSDPLDRFCTNKSCGDYMGSWGDHITHCPSCGSRQPPG